MNDSPYAPPKAAVADVIPGPRPTRPWQVTLAVRLCWLILVFALGAMLEPSQYEVPVNVDKTLYVGIKLGVYAAMTAMLIVTFEGVARGHRWARIVYSIIALMSLVDAFRFVPLKSGEAWFYGVLALVFNVVLAAALLLMFTAPANTWFRSRGGTISPT